MTIAAATTTKKYDPIVDWKLPSSEIVQDTIKNRVQPLRTLASPVFFSTGTDGLRRRGLGFVPSTSERNDNIRRYDNNDDDKATSTKKPLLFVANHQLFGLDLGMIIAQLVEERGISARGLAHPIIFQGGGMTGSIEDNPRDTTNGNNKKSRIEKRDRNGIIKDNNDDNGSTPNDTFQNFGAVMVTPRNFYRLMQTGQTGLLFPGGVREVFHGKDEAYELFWPEKVDFVRVAARFNATIVPISAVGAADSANILIDAPDMLKLPFGLGANLANSTKNVISARFDANDSEELFQPPFIVPKALPSRHYFVFGKPFDTSLIEHKNKEECSSIYQEVKTELRRGLDDLLVAREKDPFQNTAQRLVYERVYGKQAPTFSLNELNK
jgi:1-acyl-sn-glycerol-3-phosphate acyltransferase